MGLWQYVFKNKTDHKTLYWNQTVKYCIHQELIQRGEKRKNINQEIQFPIKQFLIQRHMLKNTCK